MQRGITRETGSFHYRHAGSEAVVWACQAEIYVYTVEFRILTRRWCARVAEWQTRRI